MSKRGDNIHKRKDGRWEGRYKKGRKSDGSILYGSVYGKTYQEVKIKLSETVVTHYSGPSKVAESITLGELLNLWLENNRLRLKGGTLNKYQSIINSHIMPCLGEQNLSTLTSTTINVFLMEKMKNGRINQSGNELSASYVRSMAIVINAAINFGVGEDLCTPLKTPIIKPIIKKKELMIFTPNDITILENYLRLNISPTKLGILISLYTGMRIGEICALTWKNVDLSEKIIKVRHTIARVKGSECEAHPCSSILVMDTPKTKASIREIPISTPLYNCLSFVNQTSQSNYVISDSSNFVSPRTFEYRYQKILKECGLRPANFHTLRHTFATKCIEQGMDVKSLSEILGHANVGITLNTYVHSSLEMKRVQIEKLKFN